MNRFNLILGQAIPRAAAPKVPGTMEVIAPNDGFLMETCLPLSRHSSVGWTDTMKEPKNRQNGSLLVFGTKEPLVIEPIHRKSRKGCGNESSSKSYTPTKQILLNVPKSSLAKQSTLTEIVKDKNSTSTRQPDRIEEAAEAEICNDEQLKNALPKLNHETKITEEKTESEVIDEKEKIPLKTEEISSSKVLTEAKNKSVVKQNSDDEKPSDNSDDDDSGQENDEQKQTAPLELMGEFLKAIMEGKYSLAKKLCQMILIYEPENPEAKQFIPLIERKLLLESKLPEEEDEETDEESSDDSEEDTTTTDSSETDSEESSKDSDDND